MNMKKPMREKFLSLSVQTDSESEEKLFFSEFQNSGEFMPYKRNSMQKDSSL